MPSLETLSSQFTKIWEQARIIWATGGWAMIAIAFIAVFMSAMGFHVLLKLRQRKFRSVAEKTWRKWIDEPNARCGRLGRLMNFVLAERSLEKVSIHFDQLRASEAAPIERDLKVMKICVSAAPLVGLLGTVTGMLSTFGALSSGAGGDQTMGMIAAGISEALITTETGLVIALPGLFFHHFLVRKYDDYQLFLAHLETVCSQTIYRRIQASEDYRLASLKALGRRLQKRFPNETRRWQPAVKGIETSTS